MNILTTTEKNIILELIRQKPLLLAAKLEQLDNKAFADICKELKEYAEGWKQ